MSKKEEHNNQETNSAENAEYVLRLFVTGASPNSVRAITNLKKICDTYLKGKYSLEIIDIYQQGALASKEQIVALPLLVRKKPQPERRLIGDLSDTAKVLRGLGLNIEQG
jgi:circadian clock protein KaiB